MEIAIIGAGASGLMLGSLLDENITYFEKNKKIASKLLASGNGRCNLLNVNANPECYNNKQFMENVFKKYNAIDVLNYLKIITRS